MSFAAPTWGWGGYKQYPAAPKPAAPKPAAPSAPAPVVSAPPPPLPPPPNVSYQDSGYNEGENQISQNLANLQANLIGSGQQLGSNYGVDYTGDPVHGASGFSIAPNVDVTNPFSKAALLKKTWVDSTRGNTNSYAASGQLYSGALQNAQNETGWRYQQGNDALLKDFASQFGNLYGQYLTGQSGAAQQHLDNEANAIARAPAAEPAPPPPPAPTVNYQTPAGTPMPTTPNSPAGPAITDMVTGKVYQPAKGVALAPGWAIINGKFVKVG